MTRITIIAVLLVSPFTGCATFSKSEPDIPVAAADAEPKSRLASLPLIGNKEKPAKPVVPSRVVATWSDAVLHKSGESSQRGFGGRLFFYESNSVKPAPVEGQLVVYAFDESGRDSTDHKPTRRYVFPPEQFAKHISPSEMGKSYSVWLPWDGADGPAADVSLIARFEPLTGGQLVVSEQSRVRLPGQEGPMIGVTDTKVKSGRIEPAVVGPVRQASHDAVEVAAAPAEPTSDAKPTRQMETTTIRLPRRR